MSKILLHVEGFAVLSLSVYIYGHSNLSWILFLILLLSPDLSMLGYVFGHKIGAIIYNIFHTYSLSICVAVCGFILSHEAIFAIGLIWSAHIGMDRMFGFGLKYPTAFKETHLNRV